MEDELKHVILAFLCRLLTRLLGRVQIRSQFLNLASQSIDEGTSFLLLDGQTFGLLLVAGLVVVKPVFDGQDVLVDGNSVSKELNKQNSTFSS